MKHKPVHTLMSAMMVLLSMTALACGSATQPAATEPAPANNANSADNTTANTAAEAPGNNQVSEPAGEQSAAADTAQTNVGAATTSEDGAGNRSLTAVPVVNNDQTQISSGWFVDNATGYLHVMGSITNKTDTPITGMISFVYYDANNRPLNVDVLGDSDESDKISFSAPVAPGDTGYFHRVRDLSKVQGQIARVETALSYLVPETVSPAAEFANLQWASASFEGVTISGQVKNVGDTVCQYPTLVIAYLKGGQVVEMDEHSLDTETLEPGQETTFSFDNYLIPAAFDDVDVVIDCAPTSFPRP